MPTYDNPRTGVVHWYISERYRATTACHYLVGLFDGPGFDPVGEPADVTCCKCRETASWLDAIKAALDAEKGGE